jgi:hypothetical protein
VTGNWALEDFSIGDTGKLMARKQAFLLASKLKGFDDFKAEGMVGLGIKSHDASHKTLVETLYDAGLIKNAVFSIFLNNNRYEKDDKRKPESKLIIGGYDLDKYADGDDLKFYDLINGTGLWTIKMDSIHCKDTEIDTDSTYAVLNSNEAKIVGPRDKVDKLFKRFEAMYGCGYYYSRMVCDCSEIYSIVKFPYINIKIDGDDYEFHESHYFKKTSKVCFLMFEGADIDYWILGQPFLRKFYSIYDIQNLRVGLVSATDSRFTVETDSNWWIIPVVLIIGGAVMLFSWLGWIYYKRYSNEKLIIEQEARG